MWCGVCQVFLNGTRLPIKSFSDYVDLYLGPKDDGVPRVYERVNDRWEVCISATDGQFQQVRASPKLHAATSQLAWVTECVGAVPDIIRRNVFWLDFSQRAHIHH